jgi:hypothetical protein
MYFLFQTELHACLEKLRVPQLVKKVPAFYKTRKFIIMFMTALNFSVSLSQIISFQNVPCYFFKIHFNITLQSNFPPNNLHLHGPATALSTNFFT